MGTDTDSQDVSVKRTSALLVTTVIWQSYVLFFPALVEGWDIFFGATGFLLFVVGKMMGNVPFLNSEINVICFQFSIVEGCRYLAALVMLLLLIFSYWPKICDWSRQKGSVSCQPAHSAWNPVSWFTKV